MLQVPRGETLGKDTRFNTPAVILKFQEQKVQGQITGHVLRNLYEEGFIKDEGYVLGIEDLARLVQEEEEVA